MEVQREEGQPDKGITYNELNHLCIYVEHVGWLSHEYLKSLGFELETIELANSLSFIAPIYREGQLGYSRLDANGDVMEAFEAGK